ncbi:nicotinate-nucleotide adenylyltransferase [Alkalibacter rhizosphaerae]|uniref:Probable nicotinate-nucleotide adenylyltransferase n=1 Tax=Alkalibacter rhizosphaerae TaxID=2815577 RepID=A0A974XE60_9FIRM|nr:nicotinate-nucleotide adenylyltransferase [Alkalibacter rhizosphaerae]QSX08202.1 nicotinate-nucleotide adenylyltransferase [Alkalibacter rhizosphaerae]
MDRLKIGVLGGTFNPIHNGHLLLAESARDRLGLDKVLFIPTGNNPLKTTDWDIDANLRYEMTKRGIDGNEFFEVSDIEIKREGYTYTIDTLEELEKIYPGDEIYFIVGADIVFEIDSWKRADEVLRKINLVTTFRPGYDQDRLDRRVEELREFYGARILKLFAPEMDISSSEIRSRVKHGYSIRYLLPRSVETYIYEKELYR